MSSDVDSAAWVAVASVADVAEGHLLGVEVDGADVVVANLGDRYVAFGGECTHAGCPLSDGELDAERGHLTCWCHGSVFDVTTGEVVEPPAEGALPVYDVRVEGGNIELAGGAG
jgi:3-phenylpropionate/trans-cinnamate dioxygenase ferredoxin subunit